MPNRDLLVLTGRSGMNERDLAQHVHNLNKILYQVEGIAAFCQANEIIDINHYKVIHKPFRIQQIISEKMKPFVFIINRN